MAKHQGATATVAAVVGHLDNGGRRALLHALYDAASKQFDYYWSERPSSRAARDAIARWRELTDAARYLEPLVANEDDAGEHEAAGVAFANGESAYDPNV